MRLNTVLLLFGLLFTILGGGTFLAVIGAGMIGWVFGAMLAEDLLVKNGK